MAYNNGFPMNYQQYYPTQYGSQPTFQNVGNVGMQNNNSIIWVQGEAGAKSYLVAPNNTVQLWDSERQTIYLKSADASGMPSMKILDYTFRDSSLKPSEDMPQSNFATIDDVNSLRDEIKQIKEDLAHVRANEQ